VLNGDLRTSQEKERDTWELHTINLGRKISYFSIM